MLRSEVLKKCRGEEEVKVQRGAGAEERFLYRDSRWCRGQRRRCRGAEEVQVQIMQRCGAELQRCRGRDAEIMQRCRYGGADKKVLKRCRGGAPE